MDYEAELADKLGLSRAEARAMIGNPTLRELAADLEVSEDDLREIIDGDQTEDVSAYFTRASLRRSMTHADPQRLSVDGVIWLRNAVDERRPLESVTLEAEGEHS